MTKRVSRLPKYRRQKGKYGDYAFVELQGRHHYLGRFGAPESKEKYVRLLAEHAAGALHSAGIRGKKFTITQLAEDFLKFADGHYRKPDGTLTSEVVCFKRAVEPLKELYGSTDATEFGPKALKAVRHQMVTKYKWCRRSVNAQVQRIKHVFKWAVSEELLPQAVYGALLAVEGLKRGRTPAIEREPVKPVPIGNVDAIRPFVSRQVEALIDLQLLTGARAGELVIIRPVDLDAGGKVWIFRPHNHKTQHHGHSRVIYFGPRAQEVIKPFLAGRAIDAYMFSPIEAERERREEIHLARKTPLNEGNRPGTNRKDDPEREPGPRYDVGSYRRAIRRACDQADKGLRSDSRGGTGKPGTTMNTLLNVSPGSDGVRPYRGVGGKW